MNTNANTEQLFDDLQAVVREAEALLKATAGHAGDKVDEVRTRAEKTIKQARARIDAAEHEAVRRVKEIADDAEGYVREHPWQALGVAAGVGLILGLLMGRRS
jgi:ElaB/YqjD/DUF883 family membrane-anchored ribosome-binding protein